MADSRWQIENKVKLDKVRELTATRKDLTKQVEGWGVQRVSSQKQQGMYQSRTGKPPPQMDKRVSTSNEPLSCMQTEWKARDPCQR